MKNKVKSEFPQNQLLIFRKMIKLEKKIPNFHLNSTVSSHSTRASRKVLRNDPRRMNLVTHSKT